MVLQLCVRPIVKAGISAALYFFVWNLLLMLLMDVSLVTKHVPKKTKVMCIIHLFVSIYKFLKGTRDYNKK